MFGKWAVPVIASILIVGILGFSVMMSSTEAEIIPPTDTSKRMGEFGENVEVITLSHTPGHGTTLCHKPGTPAEKTLVVDDPAVPAHLGHGDDLGPC